MNVPAWLRFTLVLSVFNTLDAIATELPTGKPADVGLSATKLAEIALVVQSKIDARELAGVVTMVVRHGKVAHLDAHGFSNIETGEPMTPDMIFRIYSMTKPITIVAAMMLCEEGKFKLDEPVSKYLPEFKATKVYEGGAAGALRLVEPQREITIRDLMRHTAGMRYGAYGDTPIDEMVREQKLLALTNTLPDVVARLSKIPLVQHPGEKFTYGMSVDVLGRLVEVLSDQSLDRFFHSRIFEPLDMRDTAFYVPEGKHDRFASNHRLSESGELEVFDAPPESDYCKPPRFHSGGGGLMSTARDYSRFCQMVLNQGELFGTRLLKSETVKLMTKNHLPDSAMPMRVSVPVPGKGFGLGFAVRVATSRLDPASRVGEFGWGGAASTHFWIAPQDDLFVIILRQFMPYQRVLETELKPIIYDAIEHPAAAK